MLVSGRLHRHMVLDQTLKEPFTNSSFFSIGKPTPYHSEPVYFPRCKESVENSGRKAEAMSTPIHLMSYARK